MNDTICITDKVNRYLQNYTDYMETSNGDNILELLEQEEYSTRKLFVDAICGFLNDQLCKVHYPIHLGIFSKIIMPVFITEYNNDNTKYIKRVTQCENLMENFLAHQFARPLDSAYVFFQESYGRALMIDKNQDALDSLMKEMKSDILIYIIEADTWARDPNHYIQYIESFSEQLERCKIFCIISGNEKWNGLLHNWDLLVTHLYKYEEYVRNNGFITFDDYLKMAGIKIII